MRSMICNMLTIVAKAHIDPGQHSAAFDEHMVAVIDENVRYLGITKQRLKRAKAENFIQQVGKNFFLFFKGQRHALLSRGFR